MSTIKLYGNNSTVKIKIQPLKNHAAADFAVREELRILTVKAITLAPKANKGNRKNKIKLDRACKLE